MKKHSIKAILQVGTTVLLFLIYIIFIYQLFNGIISLPPVYRNILIMR
jgi:hypothetical protein